MIYDGTTRGMGLDERERTFSELSSWGNHTVVRTGPKGYGLVYSCE